MRKTTAIFLLPIMLIFAIQPVIAMHYCGGKLQSMNLSALQVATDTNPIHVAIHGKKTCCKHSHKNGTHKHTDGLYITGEGCCDTELLELTSDDYQNQVQQHSFRLLPFSIDNVVITLNGLIKLSDPKSDICPPLQEFPPGGLFLKDVSLLTYICIYRI